MCMYASACHQGEEVQSLVDEHQLNEFQAQALRHVAAMFDEETEQSSRTPITLIHGNRASLQRSCRSECFTK